MEHEQFSQLMQEVYEKQADEVKRRAHAKPGYLFESIPGLGASVSEELASLGLTYDLEKSEARHPQVKNLEVVTYLVKPIEFPSKVHPWHVFTAAYQACARKFRELRDEEGDVGLAGAGVREQLRQVALAAAEREIARQQNYGKR